MKLNKGIFKYLIIFFFTFIIGFYYTCFHFWVSGDEVWNYGFAYNIATGLIPYRDFNMVVTPLYSFIGSIFIKIFGSYLYSLHILDAVLISIITILLFKKIGYRALIIFPFLICFCIPSYNFLCLFWLFLIIYLCDSNKNDNLIGLIISLAFLTKQTVGICLFIPYFLYSKDKFKSFIIFLIPILLFSVYLIWNDALFNFIDYCFLGLFDFGNKNTLFEVFSLFEIIVLLVLIIIFWKGNFKNKELAYVLFFQIMSFPIMDFYHCFFAFIPVLYLMIKRIKVSNIVLIFISLLVFYLLCDFSVVKNIYRDDNYLKYRVESGNFDSILSLIEKYDGDNELFLFVMNAYAVKLLIDEPINKFDLINNGNMGYRGEIKYIEDISNICSNKNCVFIINNLLYYNEEGEYYQSNLDILEYVYSNYEKVDNFEVFDVLSN